MVSSAIPLPVVLEILDLPKPSNIQHVLKSLYLAPETISTASKADLNHFVSKVNNLLVARDDYKRWYSSHIVQIVGANPVVLTVAGANFITSLLKLINDSNTVTVNFQNAVLALDTIIREIRGKPVLTREILTPNLPNIISALLDHLERDFVVVLPILSKLLIKNTTTFKPFLKRFETKLLTILVNHFNEIDSGLQALVCKCYAYLHLIKPNVSQTTQGSNQPLPDDQWRLKMLQLMDELRSVVLIYDNMIDLKSERESMDLIKQLPDLEKKEYIFPFLQVDLSQPITLISISDRINVLVKLLTAFITSTTPFPIRVPLGMLVQLCNLLMGISPNYIPLKGDLKRDPALKKIVLNDMIKTQNHGCCLVLSIVKQYKKLVLPHLNSILSSLEVIVPVVNEKGKKAIKIDRECALNAESEMLNVIHTTTEMLKLFEGLTELELINKLVDVSTLLLEKRTPLDSLLDKQPIPTNVANNSQSVKNRKKKNKDSTPMSDLLSHAELFEMNAPKCTVNTINNFYHVLIKKLPNLAATYRIKIVKYAISTGVKQQSLNGSVSEDLTRLLESLVLYPSNGDVYSVLPIVKKLLPNNEKLSLLTNPRFPILDVKYKKRSMEELIEEDDDEEDQIMEDEVVEAVKDNFVEELKISQEVTAEPTASVFKTTEEMKTLSFPEAATATITVETVETEQKTRSLEDADDTPSKRVKVAEQITEIEAKDDDYDDSDFEIPEIELSDEE